MGKRKATKELTVGEMVAQQKAELATQAMNPTSWGKVTLTKNDLIIPRLQLVQAMSEIVAQKKAAPGEIRDSLNNVLMAKEGITLEVIPLFVHKRFKVNKLIEGKGGKVEKEFHEMINIQDNPTLPGFNDDLAWQDAETIEGKLVPIERVRTYDMFFILPKSGRDVAYVMSFASSNIKAAKNMILQMAINQEAGKTPAAYCFNLDITTKTKDRSTWFVIDSTLGREASEDEQGQAFKWYKRLQAGEAKVHDDIEVV
jgi:hypothetical protein